MQVASHDGWLADPNLVNQFYNERRQQLFGAQPNKGHLLIAELEKQMSSVDYYTKMLMIYTNALARRL